VDIHDVSDESPLVQGSIVYFWLCYFAVPLGILIAHQQQKLLA
jgi:hypothetical protein